MWYNSRTTCNLRSVTLTLHDNSNRLVIGKVCADSVRSSCDLETVGVIADTALSTCCDCLDISVRKINISTESIFDVSSRYSSI